MTIKQFQDDLCEVANHNGNEIVTLDHAGLVILTKMDDATTTLDITELLNLKLYYTLIKEVVNSNKNGKKSNNSPKFSPSVDSIIKGSILAAKSSADVTELHVLIEYICAVIDNNGSELTTLCKACDDPSELRIQLKAILGGETIANIESQSTDKAQGHKELPAPLRDYFCGNRQLLEKVIQTTNTKKGSIIAIVGEQLSGKTALVDSFNFWLQNTKELRIKKSILSLDIPTIARASAFEQYLTSSLTDCEEQNAILLVDNIHYLNDAHRDPEFMPFFASAADKGVTIICTLTPDTFSLVFDRRGYKDRVERIDIEKHSKETRQLIIQNISDKISNRDEVIFTKESLETLNNVIEESFSHSNINTCVKVLERCAVVHDADVVTDKVMKNVLAETRGTASHDIKSTETKTIKNLASIIKTEIYGQDEAIDLICRQIQLSHLGLKVRDNQPRAAFMLLGGSGIGKTETTEIISRELDVKCLILNMAEYKESHTVSKLIGAPVGYIGSDKGDGMLAEFVALNPTGIIVFDEIEKANPKIFDLLLSVLDKGTLTTSTQKDIDFCKNTLFFTSNCGAQNIGKEKFGLYKDETVKESVNHKAFEQIFSPEFRNRLTSVIDYKTLSEADIIKVTKKSIDKLVKKSKAFYDIDIQVTNKVITFIGTKYFNKALGARPIERGVEIEIGNRLGEILVSSQQQPKVITFKVKNNELISLVK